MGPIGLPETSVQNYQSTLRSVPEERRSHLHSGGSLKSRMLDTAVVGQCCVPYKAVLVTHGRGIAVTK